MHDRLERTAATRSVRKGLLDTAIAGLDQVAANAEAAAPDLGRAVAHQKLGDIYRQVGRNEEALKQYTSRAELASQLAKASPQNPAITECLARSYSGLGELCLNAESNQGGRATISCRSVLLAEKYAPAIADQRQARAALLDAYFRLGRAYGFDRDLEPSRGLVPQDGSPRRALDRRRARQRVRPRPACDQPPQDRRHARSSRTTTSRPGPITPKRRSGPRADRGRAEQPRREAASGAGARRPGGDLAQARPARRGRRRWSARPSSTSPSLSQADPEDIDNRMRLHQTQYHSGLPRDWTCSRSRPRGHTCGRHSMA